MTALKTLTIIKQTLAGWHTRTGGTKKDTCRCTFKKKKKKWRAVTPHSPLMSHWKGGMCQLSFVTAHLRFNTVTDFPLSPTPPPGGGLTSAFCFHSLQNTKVGRKKKKIQFTFQSHCQTPLPGCFQIIPSADCCLFSPFFVQHSSAATAGPLKRTPHAWWREEHPQTLSDQHTRHFPPPPFFP